MDPSHAQTQSPLPSSGPPGAATARRSALGRPGGKDPSIPEAGEGRRVNGTRQGPGPDRPPPWTLSVWWITLVLLLLWNFSMGFNPGQAPTVARVPYSVFIDQVRSGNVSEVAIKGSEILGKLREARDWNPETGLLNAAPPSAAPPQKGAEGARPGSAPGTTRPASQGPATPAATGQAQPVQVRAFATVFPSSVGDPSLLPLLEEKGVEIVAAAEPSHWLGRLLGGLLPVFLLLAFFWWMGRRAFNQQQSIFGVGKSQARRFHREDGPPVTFEDVAGADTAKAQLQEIVEILKAPERFRRLGARTPRGVLLVGPPGTGKTLLARAVAGEAGVPFFSISGSEFVEMFVGVGASRVRALFKEVKEAAPAILFVDELDAVGRRRGAGLGMVNDEREQTLNQLLVEMDGFDDRQSVIVLAATNRPDVLDPALRRPGRFDRDVAVELPDLRGRLGILGIYTRGLRLASDVSLEQLAAMTTGMSGAQLANLCNEAALMAARVGHEGVAQQDLERALDKVVLGEERALALDPETRRVIACHEAGHALVAWLTPQADPVHKVTIVPHGLALGVTEQRPSDDRYNLSRGYLLARLDVMLGGRAAEEVVIGDITTGAQDDLRQATELARRMVTSWGMSNLGLAAYERGGEDPFLGYDLARPRAYSEETARQIDNAVHAILEERHRQARDLLDGARDRLERLAETLLHRETVGQDELARLLGPRPPAGAAFDVAG
ncbi:MAG: ATP-dependent zinc metalloprotease FtsH [Bdellovibrio bacteriovorus]